MNFFRNKKRWLKIVHLSSLAWAIYAELLAGVICPLISIESYLSYRAGLATYKEDFITRYLIPVIYQESLSIKVQYLVVFLVVCINLIAYNWRWKQKLGG